MGIGDLGTEAKRLRSAEPPRAIRGFDEGQTRKLLERAAKLLEGAALELQEMRQECERLRSSVSEEASAKEAIGAALLKATRVGEEITAEARAAAERTTAEAEARAATILEQAAAKEDQLERDKVAIARKLEQDRAALRAAVEEENAAARVELEGEREQFAREQGVWRDVVEAERARVREEAQARADDIVADARREVERLQTNGERLRALFADSQRRFVELAESALRQLDGIEVNGPSGDGKLLDDLLPSKLDQASSASTVAADSLD